MAIENKNLANKTIKISKGDCKTFQVEVETDSI